MGNLIKAFNKVAHSDIAPAAIAFLCMFGIICAVTRIFDVSEMRRVHEELASARKAIHALESEVDNCRNQSMK